MVDVTELQKQHIEKITREKKLITIKECSQLTGIGERKLRELAHTKGFPVIRFGKKCMIVGSLIDEWIINHIGETS
ncbi:helix-turn-helix domain-containing protein [Clostridium thermobutyricum]|uniref:helix-turn-helix transcriptional regulator n=1 Tax=Clostridium thermobutyricum TaxID=29372 RepID=UPI0029428EA5|nr:helix-turn-helix domain-containing protein [Clostridium thermobutyricum]